MTDRERLRQQTATQIMAAIVGAEWTADNYTYQVMAEQAVHAVRTAREGSR